MKRVRRNRVQVAGAAEADSAAAVVAEAESAIAGKHHEYLFMGGCHRKMAAPRLFMSP
jgi:hypothetical protein